MASLASMLEKKILSFKFFFFFFFSQLSEHFHRTIKKIENPAKYKLFLPKPLTRSLFWWRFSRLVVLKGLKQYYYFVMSPVVFFINRSW